MGFSFVYKFLVKVLVSGNNVSIVVHTQQTTVHRKIDTFATCACHCHHLTHRSEGLFEWSGAFPYRFDARVCCHFWRLDESMKCKKRFSLLFGFIAVLCSAQLSVQKSIVLSWFRNADTRMNIIILPWIIFPFTLTIESNWIELERIVCLNTYRVNRSIQQNHICQNNSLTWKSLDTLKEKKWFFKIFFRLS